MQRIRVRIIIATVALATVGFIVNLLINYASATVPRVFLQHPYLVWILAAVGLAVSSALMIWQYMLEKGKPPSKSLPLAESVHSAQEAESGENPMHPHKHDVFISYSHKDAKWGDWLHRSLEKYRVPWRLRDCLRPISHSLLQPLETMFDGATLSETQQLGAANAIADFAARDGDRLARNVSVATAATYEVLFTQLLRLATERAISMKYSSHSGLEFFFESSLSRARRRWWSASTVPLFSTRSSASASVCCTC